MKNALSIGLCLLTTNLFTGNKLNDTVKTLLPVIVTGKIQSPEKNKKTFCSQERKMKS
jgi:Fe(3+) dicitrate transport protein